ncbi:serine O-acetyltransferase [Erythrobacter aureus]|uniref:serine O-acetyltransferase n=1 Tax=Erythrobacter aureus TaxID=2182384 RepID=UPI003A8EF675
MTIADQISNQMRRWLVQCGATPGGRAAQTRDILYHVRTAAKEAATDLQAYLDRDPASTDAELVARAHAGFKTVAAFRLAHRLHTSEGTSNRQRQARQVSELAKARWGAELHPAARIGSGFVLDHGANTVIGETTEIGAGCMVLNNVTLGALSIAGNPAGPRHPTVGARVQIGAGARIFGRIAIGDDAFIGPGAIITTSVPAGSRVIRRAEVQLQFGSGPMPIIFGIVPGRIGHLHILGEALEECRIRVIGSDTLEPVDFAECVQIGAASASRITLSIALMPGMPVHDRIGIEISGRDGSRCVLLQNPGLRVALHNLANQHAHEIPRPSPEIHP